MSALFTISNLGILVTAAGGILSAVAVGPPKEGGASVNDAEVMFLNYPKLFRLGLVLIAIGSTLQLKLT